MKLTRNQKVFCDEYLIDLNATRAYKEAYKNVKKDETAAVNGSRLLRNAKVKAYIDKKMKEREERTEITQDKVLKELARIGFANAADYVKVEIKESKGNLYSAVAIRETDSLSEDQQSAIAGIKQGRDGIEVKLNDKIKALELIGRHLGMFTDKIDMTVENSEKFADIIDQLGGEGLEEE